MSTLSPSRRALLLLLSVAQLMVILDVSAVNVALPSLAHDLGIGRTDLAWAITSYSLMFGSLLLFGGRAADLLGRRRMFLTGLAVFATASLGVALAPSEGVLFGTRAVQGIGAALLSPAALSLITVTFASGRERTMALGVWGAISGAGAAFGVLFGGLLTEVIDWRAIFFVNPVVGTLVAIGVLATVPSDGAPARWRGLDLRGAVVVTASLGALLYAISGAATAGWASAQTIGLGGAGLFGLAVFAAFELRTRRPLVVFGRLGDRAVGGGLALMLLASAVLFGSFLLTSVYLQEVLDSSALAAGLEFLPIAAAAGAGAHLASQLVRRAGVRAVMAAAFALACAGTLLLSQLPASGSYFTDVLPGMVVVGFAIGSAMVSVSVAVLTAAGHDDAGMLSGLSTTGHEVGGALGLAALITIASQGMRSAGPTASHASIAAGLGDGFLVAAAIAAIGLLLAVVLLPAAGEFLPQLRKAPQRVGIH